MLVQLIYVSKATEKFTDLELQRLLEVSVRNNEPRDITGMLLYADGEFMQVLEGDADAVEHVFQKISTDPRHRDVITISKIPTPVRKFANWRMGFRHITPAELAQNPAWIDFFSRVGDESKKGVRAGGALALLTMFADRK